MSPIIVLIVFLVIAGICLYLLPMDESIKKLIIKIITVISVIVVIFWLLQIFGINLSSFGRIR